MDTTTFGWEMNVQGGGIRMEQIEMRFGKGWSRSKAEIGEWRDDDGRNAQRGLCHAVKWNRLDKMG